MHCSIFIARQQHARSLKRMNINKDESPNAAVLESTCPHGARLARRTPKGTVSGFNPLARMGRDVAVTGVTCAAGGFQSTRPHGARQNDISQGTAITGFNPSARMGRDQEHSLSPIPNSFQSTRPHGARRVETGAKNGTMGFQSTRPHGA